ncbi:MAG: hypothetical protein RBR40_08520 [Tenuifilaceae bacterium]|nr:hypothetical protein [Tenuifilaceae bacterium]
MAVSDIYSKIRWILMVNFRVKDIVNYHNADLRKDIGLDGWDLNLLVYLVETTFDIKLKVGIENDLVRLDQLALLVHAEMKSEMRLRLTA